MTSTVFLFLGGLVGLVTGQLPGQTAWGTSYGVAGLGMLGFGVPQPAAQQAATMLSCTSEMFPGGPRLSVRIREVQVRGLASLGLGPSVGLSPLFGSLNSLGLGWGPQGGGLEVVVEVMLARDVPTAHLVLTPLAPPAPSTCPAHTFRHIMRPRDRQPLGMVNLGLDGLSPRLNGGYPYPGSLSSYSSGSYPYPGSLSPYPGGGSPYPGVSPYPGGGNPYPGGVYPYPGSVSPYPGGVSPFPGGFSPYPGGGNPLPGGLSPYPWAGAGPLGQGVASGVDPRDAAPGIVARASIAAGTSQTLRLTLRNGFTLSELAGRGVAMCDSVSYDWNWQPTCESSVIDVCCGLTYSREGYPGTTPGSTTTPNGPY